MKRESEVAKFTKFDLFILVKCDAYRNKIEIIKYFVYASSIICTKISMNYFCYLKA